MVHGRGPSLPAPAASLNRVGTEAIIAVRPDLLVVTAERVKRAVEQRLNVSDRWRSRIHLQLRNSARMEGPVSIRAKVFRDGWQFYIPVPDRIEWQRLVRALVEVVLLERSNRANTGMDCALVPLWLTEGMCQLLLSEEGRDLVAETATVLNRSQLKPDPLTPVRLALQGREPLPFSELSLVTYSQLEDPARFREFQATATLFTWEFLHTDSGRLLLRTFLEQLSGSLNWQTALLRSSNGGFQTLLDVEKWWAVSSADTLSSDPAQRWPRERVLDRLEELRVETAEVRVETNSPPVQQRVTLAELVVKWDYPTQREVLLRKMTQWRVLALRSAPDLARLCSDYARIVSEYVGARDRAGLGPTPRGGLESRANLVAAAAARRLRELDQRLEAERGRKIPERPSSTPLQRGVGPPPQLAPAR